MLELSFLDCGPVFLFPTNEVGVALRLHRARLLSLVRVGRAEGVVCSWRSSQPRPPHRQTTESFKAASGLAAPNTDLEFPDDFEDVGSPANQLKLLAAFS